MDLYNVRQQLSMGVSLSSIYLRVTDYSRVSTDHFEQRSSLKNQMEHFDEMINNNKNWTYVQGYVDDGVGGTTDYKRNNFMRMIEDAKKGLFDLIITKEISRFSRNTLDSIRYTRELLSYGVGVLFVNDNINTVLPDSELRLTIMASMAQDEIRRLSERVKFGMNRAIKNGTILGNNMLYGYRKDKITGNLIINYKEAIVVRKLFHLYAINNWSIGKIVKLFNEMGINKSVTTLRRMIKNPKYKGYYCGGKTEIIDYMTKKVKYVKEDNWVLYEDKIRIPPIVSDDLWERANKRLLLRSKYNYKENKIMYQNRYSLSAKIYCFEHNAVFHRRKQCRASDDITWVCGKHLSDGKRFCNCSNVRESEIYTIFNDIVKILKIDLGNVYNILFELYKNNKENNDNYYKKIELINRRNKLLIRKDKLLELNVEGNLSNSEFNDRNRECNKELADIEDNIVFLENIQNNDMEFEVKIKRVINDININDLLIGLLLNKIIVKKIGNNECIDLIIYLNFSKEMVSKFNKVYSFKRGYNSIKTKRYIVNYNVCCCFSE